MGTISHAYIGGMFLLCVLMHNNMIMYRYGARLHNRYNRLVCTIKHFVCTVPFNWFVCTTNLTIMYRYEATLVLNILRELSLGVWLETAILGEKYTLLTDMKTLYFFKYRGSARDTLVHPYKGTGCTVVPLIK